MGEAELDVNSQRVIIHSTFFFYGDAASDELARQVADDIDKHWNEPNASINIRGKSYNILFHIEGVYEPDLKPETVWYNTNPRFNFFRIEEFVIGNISFVDGLGCNTGYFKLDNLRQTSTTAAHEYGHTLGLKHPNNLDIRGKQVPGIMYPRGTVCDPHFQYDATAIPLQPGGTLDPVHRKVTAEDMNALNLSRLTFNNKPTIIGDFSSMYHEKHISPDQ